jgi:hypothetical protein
MCTTPHSDNGTHSSKPTPIKSLNLPHTPQWGALGVWLRIAHCYMVRVFPIPEAINLATGPFRDTGLGANPLGDPRNLRVSPPFEKGD